MAGTFLSKNDKRVLTAIHPEKALRLKSKKLGKKTPFVENFPR
jgi:hypothetical protein